MKKEITIKIGGIYSMTERTRQVLVMAPDKTPLIFSHDKNIMKAIEEAILYIENHCIEVKDDFTKKIK